VREHHLRCCSEAQSGRRQLAERPHGAHPSIVYEQVLIALSVQVLLDLRLEDCYAPVQLVVAQSKVSLKLGDAPP
jgi:hypothetical protein